MQETRVGSLGRDDALEEEMATHSSVLAWKSRGQRSLAGYSLGDGKQAGHDLVTEPSRRAKPCSQELITLG